MIHGPGLPSRVADIAFIGHLVLEYHVQLGDTMMHKVVYPEFLYYYGEGFLYHSCEAIHLQIDL